MYFSKFFYVYINYLIINIYFFKKPNGPTQTSPMVDRAGLESCKLWPGPGPFGPPFVRAGSARFGSIYMFTCIAPYFALDYCLQLGACEHL